MKRKQFLVVIVCLTLKLTESDSKFGTFNFPEFEHMKYEVHISPLPMSERDAFGLQVRKREPVIAVGKQQFDSGFRAVIS